MVRSYQHYLLILRRFGVRSMKRRPKPRRIGVPSRMTCQLSRHHAYAEILRRDSSSFGKMGVMRIVDPNAHARR